MLNFLKKQVNFAQGIIVFVLEQEGQGRLLLDVAHQEAYISRYYILWPLLVERQDIVMQ